MKNINTSKLLSSFRQILKSSGCTTKDGFTCLQTECKACNKFQTKIPTPVAFVNKITGVFSCPTCDFNAPLDIMEEIYKDPSDKRKKVIDLKNYFGKPYKSKLVTTENTQAISNLELSKKLDEMFIELGDIGFKKMSPQYDPDNNLLYLPLKNYSGRIVGEKVYNIATQAEETYPKSKCSGLLMYSSGIKPKKAILVTNLKDYFSLVISKLNDFTIVCLPYKLKSLPQECLPMLDNFKEIVMWFEPDAIGWDIARNFAEKLNEDRCLYIRPTDAQITPYNALKNNMKVKNILNLAQPLQHKYITSFAVIKEDVLSELQNIDKVNGVKWKRFPTLNKLLKGHRKGELTILTGPTGSGKTTFMSEYSLDLAQQGVSTLWGSFEIRNTRLASTLLRQFVGYSLNEKLDEFDYWAEQFEKFPIFFTTFHGQQNIKLVMDAIEHAQYIYDIQHVIIDNVQFMMGITGSTKIDKFWEQDSIIDAFRKFATVKNVHVTLVMHPRKERDTDDLTTNSIFGSAKATQEADNILIVQDKRLSSVRGKKYLQVAKNRYSGDLGIMPLIFDKDSLCFSQKPANVEKQTKQKE